MDARYHCCCICSTLFLVCRSCGFNKHYCSPECAGIGRAESKTEAWARFRKKVRSTEEGKKRHRDEMRALRAKKKIARVGDQLFSLVSEASNLAGVGYDSAPASPAIQHVDTSGEAMAARRPVCAAYSRSEPADSGLVAWTLFVVPELAEQAQRLLKSKRVVPCACCGRRGRVAKVIVKPEPPWTAYERACVRRRHERMQR